MSRRIVLLPGDGVGPEVTAAARAVLEAADARFGLDLSFAEHLVGGAAIDATGEPLPAATLAAAQAADAVFLGAVGGPRWTSGPRPEAGLLALREALGLFANLRPVAIDEALIDRSPLKIEAVRDLDLLIVRELTSGLYFGERTRTATSASDLCTYTVEEIERVARVAFHAARARTSRVTSIDKANVLETSRLWRETVTRLHTEEFADVALDHGLVDSAALQLVLDPQSFCVILTENLFGDILSDQAAGLVGSIGLLGSASLGERSPGLFEPIHGSAPALAGQGLVNPVGAIRSAAMMLRYGLKEPAAADAIESAVTKTLASGPLTPDLGGSGTTARLTHEIVAAVAGRDL